MLDGSDNEIALFDSIKPALSVFCQTGCKTWFGSIVYHLSKEGRGCEGRECGEGECGEGRGREVEL